jgi:polyribonucleotide nucleotidyltransferase
LTEKGFEPAAQGWTQNIKEYVCEVISKRILDKEQRLDGRSITDVRQLTVEVDLLPRVLGSAMFMRGDTQVLSIVTLGAPGDVQTLDTMEEEGKKRYMHHYNDAPFTYGEAGPMRGPGRRAIGHGACRTCLNQFPDQTTFPYAIRVVSSSCPMARLLQLGSTYLLWPRCPNQETSRWYCHGSGIGRKR